MPSLLKRYLYTEATPVWLNQVWLNQAKAQVWNLKVLFSDLVSFGKVNARFTTVSSNCH